MVAHRNAPVADPACLYGLIGDVAHAGSEGTETNAVAIAANFMAYLSCAVRRGVYLPVGNTRHHARLFCLHVGRSGRGRKGDAVSLVLRIDQALRAMDEGFAPQIHRGGLSSREGLVALMHDGYHRLTIGVMRGKRPDDTAISKTECLLFDRQLECAKQARTKGLEVHSVGGQAAREK